MVTPIYINNRDWLTSTRPLAEKLAAIPRTHVVIIDNCSTWGPLLDWYDNCGLEVVRLKENVGHEAPWRTGTVLSAEEHKKRYGTDTYVITDADLDISKVPDDLLDLLQRGLDRYPKIVKAGLGLRLDDLPKDSPITAGVKKHEKQFWVKEADSEFFHGNVDTTLALWRTSCMNPSAIGPAVRSKAPYIARHLPWYITEATITDEQRHFLANSGKCSTWGAKLRDNLNAN